MSSDSDIQIVSPRPKAKPANARQSTVIPASAPTTTTSEAPSRPLPTPLSPPAPVAQTTQAPRKTGGRPKPKPKTAPQAVKTESTNAGSKTGRPKSYMDYFMQNKPLAFRRDNEIFDSGKDDVPQKPEGTTPAQKAAPKIISLDSSTDDDTLESDSEGDDKSGKHKKKPKITKKPVAPARATASPSKKRILSSATNTEDTDSSDLDPLDDKSTKRKIAKAKAAEKKKRKLEEDIQKSNRRSPRKSDGPHARSSPSPDSQERADLALKMASRNLNAGKVAAQKARESHLHGIDNTFDDSMSQVDLDPDLLQAIAKTRSVSPDKTQNATSLPSIGAMLDPDLQQDLGSEVVLTIKMTAFANPAIIESMLPLQREQLLQWESPIIFKMRARQTFNALFDFIAKAKGMARQEIVFECNGKRVWSSATPDSHGIFFAATLNGYKEQVWQQIADERHTKKLALPKSPPKPTAVARAAVDAIYEGDPELDEVDEVAEGNIRLTLRSRGLQECPVEIAKTTTVRALLKHYLKAVGMIDRLNDAFVEMEGDKIEPSAKIQETEIEDDDQVDIVILA